ncbi:MAG: hypothetical protein ABI210_10085 [Abditibacteriaceae bacterium]
MQNEILIFESVAAKSPAPRIGSVISASKHAVKHAAKRAAKRQ